MRHFLGRFAVAADTVNAKCELLLTTTETWEDATCTSVYPLSLLVIRSFVYGFYRIGMFGTFFDDGIGRTDDTEKTERRSHS
jgi:hypothetical protein